MNQSISDKYKMKTILSFFILNSIFINYAYSQGIFAGLIKPVSVYVSWSAYDEAADTVKLTEALAMKELNEIIRLKKLGVQIDYYVIDDYWFDKNGGYRVWRKNNWSENGYEKWIQLCQENDIKPGLWVASNNVGKLNPIAEWENSLNKDRNIACFFTGGFLDHFMKSLQFWYNKGIRLYKFDFAWFMAATPEAEKIFTPREIYDLNFNAFSAALRLFRAKNPDVVFVAYNGYLEWLSFTGFPKFMNSSFLDIFDAMYCGDPRAADIPCMNFWRSMDMFSDQQVRLYENNGLPLSRIDNAAFMIGTTGSAYKRGNAAWRGMLLLSLARGGWFNSYYGNLELLNEADGKWFAKIQKVYYELQEFGQITTFGEMPISRMPYGFKAESKDGALYTIVNPSQSIQKVTLSTRFSTSGTFLFSDAGFEPTINGNEVTLGPEQIALVGYGEFSDLKYDFGLEKDVVVPKNIEKLSVDFKKIEKNKYEAMIENFDAVSDIRIVCSLKGNDDKYYRVAEYKDVTVGQLLKLTAKQNGNEVPVTINYDKKLWSGTSWASGEIANKSFVKNAPLIVTYTLDDPNEIKFEGTLYKVRY
jgi:hypothetical protein